MGNVCVVLRAKYKSVCVLIFLVFVSLLLSACVVSVFLSNLSGVPVVGVMNVCTFLGSLLTLFSALVAH